MTACIVIGQRFFTLLLMKHCRFVVLIYDLT